MRSQASQIRWNAFFSFLSSFIRLTTNFLLFVGIARLYGTEAFGQFTTAHTFSTVFILFADFGFDMLLATEIARQKERVSELAQKYLSMKILFCSVATIAMLLFPSFKVFSNETQNLIYIFSFYVLFSSLNNFFFALFKGLEQLHHETKISFIINALLLCSLIVFGYLHVSLIMIALFFVGSRVIGLFLALTTASRMLPKESLRLKFQGWRETMPQIFSFGFHFLFGNLFFVLDTILLSFLKGNHDVGIYQSVFKIVVLVLILPEIAINSLMPALSRLHGSDEEKWAYLGRLLYKTLTLVALPLTTVLFIYAEQIIDIIYGAKAFGEAIPVLRIFAVTIFIRFAAETYALLLTTSRRQFSRMAIVVVATLINFLLNVWLIPHYGVVGAAVVSLITNIFVAGANILLVSRIFVHWNADVKWAYSILLAMLVAVLFWQWKTMLVWYVIPPVLILYALLYFIGYSKEERALIFATAGRKFNI